MTSDPAGSSPDPAKGLPPVVPPSGRFLAQLFIVPGLIVAGAVGALLAFSWLAGGNKSSDAFLKSLDSTNPDIPWRTASDLAQVLKRDGQLASDPAFGLKLAQLLEESLGDIDRAELARATTPTADIPARERREALARRSYTQYLIACLGNLTTPVGAPVLTDIARKTPSRDPKTNALLRRQAVWALASLGDNVQKAAKKPAEERNHALATLESAAETATGSAGGWARKSIDSLKGVGSLGVIPALVECANDDDPFMRQQVAFALSFWTGTTAENEVAEATLLKLARDDGHGATLEITKDD